MNIRQFLTDSLNIDDFSEHGSADYSFSTHLYRINKNNLKQEGVFNKFKQIYEEKEVLNSLFEMKFLKTFLSFTNERINLLVDELTNFPETSKHIIDSMRSFADDSDIKNKLDDLDNILKNLVNDPKRDEMLLELINIKKIVNHFHEDYKNFIEYASDNTEELLNINNNFKDKSLLNNHHFESIHKHLKLLDNENFFKHYNFVNLDSYNKKIKVIGALSLDIFQELRKKGFTNTVGNSYHDQIIKSRTSISGFLNHQESLSVNPQNKILINSKTYKSLLFFEDGSLLINKVDGMLCEIDSINALKNIKNDLLKEYFLTDFSRHQYYHKIFSEIGSSLDKNIVLERFFDTIDTFKNNQQILKHYKFDYLKTYKDHLDHPERIMTTFERVSDTMHKIIKNHNVKQFAYSITSKKYEHLYDKDTYRYMEALYDLEITKLDLQNYIGRKIALYKNPDEFNTGLALFLNSFNGFDRTTILEKAHAQKTDIIYDSDNKLILQIKSFSQSQTLGNSSWCISRDASYFDSYTSDDQKQYFLFDFNKNSIDLDSLVGITLKNGAYVTAHFKNDTLIPTNNVELLNNIDLIVKSQQKLKSIKQFKI